MGDKGRGTPEHFDVVERIDVLTGTLGEAMGGAAATCRAGARSWTCSGNARGHISSRTAIYSPSSVSVEIDRGKTVPGTGRECRFVVQTETPDPVFVKVRRALGAVILGADDGSHFYKPAFARLCDPYGSTFGICGGFMAIRISRRVRSRPFPRLPDGTVADLPSQLQKVVASSPVILFF